MGDGLHRRSHVQVNSRAIRDQSGSRFADPVFAFDRCGLFLAVAQADGIAR